MHERKRHPVKIAALLLCLSAPVIGADEVADAKPAEAMTEVINQFSDCAGFYKFMSELNKELAKPETAKEMENLSTGAMVSALYLLASEHASKTKVPKPYGDFQPYVDGRMDAKLTSLRAIAERQEVEPLKEEVAVCNSVQELQAQILQRVRDAAYR